MKEVINKTKILLKVVLDQLYQLMVFETPSDHFFQRRGQFCKKFGRPPKNRKIANTKVQDTYHMKEHLICYKMTPKSSLNSLWGRSYEFFLGRPPPEGYPPPPPPPPLSKKIILSISCHLHNHLFYYKTSIFIHCKPQAYNCVHFN